MRFASAVLALLISTAALAQPSPQAKLDEGRVQYERGDFEKAVQQIHPLLYPKIELRSEDAVVEAHRLLALSYFFLKKESEAEEEVTSLLALRPAFELDPVVEPPVAVAFFQGVRRKQEDRLREIRERQLREKLQREKEEAQRRLQERMVVSERNIVRHSRWVAALPFGIGQWQNGHKKRAILFGVSEAVTGALSIATFLAVTQEFPGGQYKLGQRSLALGLYSTYLVSGGAFWALVIAGIVEAEVHFVAEHVENKQLVPLLQNAAPKISVSPILSPGFYGFGVQGAF